MVFKFLGKGKKSEYFLEAPPATNGAEPVAKLVHKVAEVADTVTDKVAEVTEKVADKVADKATDKAKTESAPAKPEPNLNAAPEAQQPKAKKFKKAKANSEATEAKTEAKAPSPQKAAAKSVAQSEPVKNFATDFLMPTSTPRRRPGPSLDMFKEMAKDVSPRK